MSTQIKKINPYNQTTKNALSSYKTNLKTGLNKIQVENRRKIYGKNYLEKKIKISPIKIFLNQFKSFIIYILLFAIIIAALAGEKIDAIVILIIVIFNSIFGFIQEYKAEKSIEALQKLSSLKSKVIRNSKITLIDSKELVPGDIILVEEGTKISADCKILESSSLQVSEASLTGESLPVSKSSNVLKGEIPLAKRENMLFSGTIITRGTAKAMVTSIGMHTQIGKIAGLISNVKKEITPLQKRLAKLGKKIGIITIIIAIIIFLTGIIREKIYISLLNGEFLIFLISSKTWLLTSVALAVAAVPEGLPAVVTISLAISIKKMLSKNTLIRKLPSVETLGETTIICSDKTGTLTKNEMTVTTCFVNAHELKISDNGYTQKGKISLKNSEDNIIFKIGVLCNDSNLGEKNKIIGDPTECALLVSAKKAGLNYQDIQKLWTRKDSLPFNGIKKMMSTLNQDPKTKKTYVYTKGAPEKVLDKCTKIYHNSHIQPLTASLKKQILKKNKNYAKKTLRVLAFAYKPSKKISEKDLIFVGLQCMRDPPHEEVKKSIQICKQAHIGVIMITGDNIFTAQSIAKEIGITGKSMLGTDFEKLSKSEQLQTLKTTSVFARVEPKHKLMIVKLLQSQGQIVSVTGDGVNDAPAIKQANLGIAMGIQGTDVTKEASQMILLDDNFTTIVNAIEEGRGINQNIKKFVNYLLSSNIAEVMVIFSAILLTLPLPMTAVMLLWLNLVTDGLPALALSVDPNPKGIMKQKPSRATILGKEMIKNIIIVAVLITIGILGLFLWAQSHYALSDSASRIMKMQTIAFTAMVMLEMVRLQNVRAKYKIPLLSNRWLILAVLSSILLQLAVIYTPLNQFFGTVPLSFLDWSMILGASIILFIISLTINRSKK